MDCRTALQLAPFDRSRTEELDAETSAELCNHLKQCPNCGPMVAQEQRLDAWLGAALRDVPIPDGLHERILHKLTAERDQRGRQRLLYLGLAAAAAVTLYVVAAQLRPAQVAPERTINLDVIATPIGAAPKRLDDVGPWFEQHHQLEVTIPEEFPRRWNFELVTSAELERLGEHSVPVLVFRNGDAVAKVYFLRSDQYLAAQAAARQASPYVEGPRVFGKPAAGGPIAYVVLGPQSRIEQFVKPIATPNG